MASRPRGPPKADPNDRRGDRPAGAPLRGRAAVAVVACAATLVLVPARAAAQAEGGVSLQTDYRLRGFSLTGRRPAGSLNLAYEDPGGAYAGASLVAAYTRPKDLQMLGHIEYAGYARRLGGGRAFDVGVQHTNLSSFASGRRTPVHYTEVYAGISDRTFSFRVHYAPNYIRPHVEVLYFDLNAVVRPVDRWRLFGHLGLSQMLGEPPPGQLYRRHDVRFGVAREIPRGDLQLEWTSTGPTATRPGAAPPSAEALVAGLSLFF
jgi:uncharacterized protein (TIGR02001 family)